MKEIDWEQRRYEIAKEMLCSIYRESPFEASEDMKASARGAALFADTLIEELKKTSK